uniref:Uncharacterized protein n=1 Tax=Trichobilharzia regenti TaxID=157069 RepID=A0AA85JQG6_TRIRE|nr:unnamed protein product [Trichobilharzia regenti]
MVKSIKRVSTVKRLRSNTSQPSEGLSSVDNSTLFTPAIPRVMVSDIMEELAENAACSKNDLLTLQKSIAELQSKFDSIMPLTQLCDPPQNICFESLIKSERIIDYLAEEAVKRIMSSHNVLAYNIPDREPIAKLKNSCLKACNMSLTECQVLRLRKKSANHPCPVLFKFRSTEEARNFLKSGKKIGSSTPYTNIRVAPDLTPCQRRCRSGTVNPDNSNRITVDDVPCVIPSIEISDHGMQQTFSQVVANVSQALYNDIDADTEMVDIDESTGNNVEIHRFHTDAKVKTPKPSKPIPLVVQPLPYKSVTPLSDNPHSVKHQSNVATQVGKFSRRYDKRPISIKKTKAHEVFKPQKPYIACADCPVSHHQPDNHKIGEKEVNKLNTKPGARKLFDKKETKAPVGLLCKRKSNMVDEAPRGRPNWCQVESQFYRIPNSRQTAQQSSRYCSAHPLRKPLVNQPTSNILSTESYRKYPKHRPQTTFSKPTEPIHISYVSSGEHVPISAQNLPWSDEYQKQIPTLHSYTGNKLPNTHIGYTLGQDFHQRQLTETPGIMHIARMISDQFLAGIANSLQLGQGIFPGR